MCSDQAMLGSSGHAVLTQSSPLRDRARTCSPCASRSSTAPRLASLRPRGRRFSWSICVSACRPLRALPGAAVGVSTQKRRREAGHRDRHTTARVHAVASVSLPACLAATRCTSVFRSNGAKSELLNVIKSSATQDSAARTAGSRWRPVKLK